MLRKIAAFIAYSLYGLMFVEAFQLNVAYVLDSDKVESMRARGFIFGVNTWGWNDHYVYRLLAAVVATAGAAFLAGALVAGRAKRKQAKNNSLSFTLETGQSEQLGSEQASDSIPVAKIARHGAWFAVIANIPSLIFWGAMFYLMTDGQLLADASNPSRTYFKWMCLVAIPVTCLVAFWAGGAGGTYQSEQFSDHTTLGIKPFHWIWAIIPLYAYSISMIAAGARFLQNMWYGWGQEGLLGTVLYLLTLIPLIAYLYPLRLSYRILSGERLADRGRALRAAAVAGSLILGLAIAIALDFGSAAALAAIGYTGKSERTTNAAYVVNTFDKWCEIIRGEDLAKKNNAQQVEYDVAAIRIDYLEKLNNELTERLKEDQVEEQSLDEKAIQQLIQERKFGAWQERDASGIHLHIAEYLRESESSTGDEAFGKWVDDFRNRLERDRSNAESRNESIQYFFRTMDNLFDELVLHSGGRQEAFSLRHTARGYESKK